MTVRATRHGSGLATSGLAWALCLSVAAPIAARSLEEIRECLASNVPKRASVLRASLASTDRGGSHYAHEARIYWRRSPEGASETLVCMTAPRDIRGLATLVHEHRGARSVWGYLPEEGRVLRFNPREAARQTRIARTAIRYEDLRYLPLNLTRAEAEPPTASSIGDRTVARVALSLPPGGDSPYTRVVASVDSESCVPLELRFHALDGDLVKVATADPATLGSEKGIRFATSLAIEDLAQGTKTAIRLEKVEIDGDPPERWFTPQSLERGRCPN